MQYVDRRATTNCKPMKKWIFVLSYAFFVLAVFAYRQSTENEAMHHVLNAQYARKMTEASQKLEELDEAVNQTLLFNESDGFTEAKDDVWRLSNDIKTAVGALPIDRGFSNTWMNYLGRLGNYAKEAEPSTQDEFVNVMQKASVNLRDMADDWQVATRDLMQGDMTVEGWRNQLESVDTTADWNQMRETVQQYTETDFPLTASESDAVKKKELQKLTDEIISRDEAVERFKTLFPDVKETSLAVENSAPGAPYPFYHIRFAYNQSIGYMDMTEKGGHILSFLVERAFDDHVLPYEELEEAATTFLENAAFDDVVLEEARENDTVWHFVFVREDPTYQAKVFSDVIHIKVAKDNGEIVGLNTMEYIQKEDVKEQPIVEQNWKTFFQPNVTVREEELAYVENDRFEQRLAYRLLVTQEIDQTTHTYVILVDTATGEVIKTERQS